MYSMGNIDLFKDKNILYDRNTMLPVVIIESDSSAGLDNDIINIMGYPNKLESLGWKIGYTLDNILNNLL